MRRSGSDAEQYHDDAQRRVAIRPIARGADEVDHSFRSPNVRHTAWVETMLLVARRRSSCSRSFGSGRFPQQDLDVPQNEPLHEHPVEVIRQYPCKNVRKSAFAEALPVPAPVVQRRETAAEKVADDRCREIVPPRHCSMKRPASPDPVNRIDSSPCSNSFRVYDIARRPFRVPRGEADQHRQRSKSQSSACGARARRPWRHEQAPALHLQHHHLLLDQSSERSATHVDRARLPDADRPGRRPRNSPPVPPPGQRRASSPR